MIPASPASIRRPGHPRQRATGTVAAALLFAGLNGVFPAVADPAGRQAVSFPAADGLRLTADLHLPRTRESGPAPVAILLHMYRSDRSAWEPLIEPLREAGFVVLALDLRGHGDSATTETRERVARRDATIFQEMQSDLRGAYDFLAARGDVDRTRIAIIGASVGASIALQYAAKDRSVDAVVGLSPGLNYMGIDSAGDARQLMGRRILLISARAESDAPLTLKSQGRDIETEILSDAKGHGTELLTEAPAIIRKIVDLVREGVGEPSDQPVYGSINSDIYHEPGSAWVKEISPGNLRQYSSAAEAKSRGLREAKSKGPTDRKRSTPDRGRKP